MARSARAPGLRILSRCGRTDHVSAWVLGQALLPPPARVADAFVVKSTGVYRGVQEGEEYLCTGPVYALSLTLAGRFAGGFRTVAHLARSPISHGRPSRTVAHLALSPISHCRPSRSVVHLAVSPISRRSMLVCRSAVFPSNDGGTSLPRRCCRRSGNEQAAPGTGAKRTRRSGWRRRGPGESYAPPAIDPKRARAGSTPSRPAAVCVVYGIEDDLCRLFCATSSVFERVPRRRCNDQFVYCTGMHHLTENAGRQPGARV